MIILWEDIGIALTVPGHVAQSVTSLTADLAADTCVSADLGVSTSIQARSHTFVEIDHEIMSTPILPFC